MPLDRWGRFERLRDIVADTLGVERERVDLDASLSEDLQVDSLDRAELFLRLEGCYAIRIEDDDVHEIRTIAQLHEYLEARRPAYVSGEMDG